MNDKETQDTPKTIAKPHSPKEEKRAQAIKYLREVYLKLGGLVYTILFRASASRITHWVGFYVVTDNIPIRISLDSQS